MGTLTKLRQSRPDQLGRPRAVEAALAALGRPGWGSRARVSVVQVRWAAGDTGRHDKKGRCLRGPSVEVSSCNRSEMGRREAKPWLHVVLTQTARLLSLASASGAIGRMGARPPT